MCEGTHFPRPLKRPGNEASAYSAAVADVTKYAYTAIVDSPAVQDIIRNGHLSRDDMIQAHSGELRTGYMTLYIHTHVSVKEC